ncbi:endonuclease [Metabacillus idriensis]|uniref:endonuclease n=1 Tax=Metabacillus idriensis TaxID=324768 RepID=UPI00174B8DA1|nr:endonuclease [Metabacillus idriensis]
MNTTHIIEQFPIQILELLTGKLLGDGNLTNETAKRPRLRFSHSIKDFGWCFHCYEQLSHNLPLTPPVYRKLSDTRIAAGYSEQYYVQSKTSLIFDHLKPLWYKERKKVLPFDLIKKTLTPLALAWWYQDDGHLKIKDSTPQKIILSTDSFDPAENIFLKKILLDLFNLKFNTDGQNRLILYDQKQIFSFLRIVRPYIHESMLRKTIHSQHKQPFFETSKRTTIYLPASLRIIKPTEEIHGALEKLIYLSSDKILHIYSDFHRTFVDVEKVNKKGYQVMINNKHLQLFHRLKVETGFNMSEVVSLAFILKPL